MIDWNHLKLLLKNSVRAFLGVCCLVIGVVGLFLPFLQGIALIMLGLVLLGNKTMMKKFEAFKQWMKKGKGG